MAIQFNFRAASITASTPNNLNFVTCNGNPTVFTLGPGAGNISDAENQARFVVSGAAVNGDTCVSFMTVRTRHNFDFTPREAGELTASTFFTPALTFVLTCAGEEGLFSLFDKAGPARLVLNTRMTVRVTNSAGAVRLLRSTGWRNELFERLDGGVTARSRTGSFAPELMEIVRTRSFNTRVLPTDTVRVTARYEVGIIAWDSSTFLIDAGSNPALGLNVPMAVIRTDP
jgi:hypothetical protein